MQSLLLLNFNINSYLVKVNHSFTLEDRGYIIKIPSKEKDKLRELVSVYVLPSLKYKLGI